MMRPQPARAPLSASPSESRWRRALGPSAPKRPRAPQPKGCDRRGTLPDSRERRQNNTAAALHPMSRDDREVLPAGTDSSESISRSTCWNPTAPGTREPCSSTAASFTAAWISAPRIPTRAARFAATEMGGDRRMQVGIQPVVRQPGQQLPTVLMSHGDCAPCTGTPPTWACSKLSRSRFLA